MGRLSKKVEAAEVARVVEGMRRVRPGGRRQLASYIEAFFGLRVPERRVCPGHCGPMDYLAWSVLGESQSQKSKVKSQKCKLKGKSGGVGEILNPKFEILNNVRNEEIQMFETGEGERGRDALGTDCLVWACRGGGKTLLGAVASLLDCLWQPGCSVRILGGSEEQSRRMYEYLTGALDRGFSSELAGTATKTGCKFANGSAVQVLAQSQASVRGHHVQRLRCDEVELFDPDVWEAAQLITQSQGAVGARLEALSTMQDRKSTRLNSSHSC